MPPDTFVHKKTLELNHWSEGAENAKGSDETSVFTPLADPYVQAELYPESMLLCCTLTWDVFVAPHLARISALMRRKGGHGEPITAEEREEMEELQTKCIKFARSALVKFTLRRTMTSRIPFGIGRPIIEIPVMSIITERVRWMGNDDATVEARALLRQFMDQPYSDLVVCITTKKSYLPQKAAFSLRWRMMSMASFSPLCAIMALATHEPSPKKAAKGERQTLPEDIFAPGAPILSRFKANALWKLAKGKSDHGRPDIDRLRDLLMIFVKAFPDKAKWLLPELPTKIKVMRPEDLEIVS